MKIYLKGSKCYGKSQFLEEIKSTSQNYYKTEYKCVYEAAIEDLKTKIIANMHGDISAEMMSELLDEMK